MPERVEALVRPALLTWARESAGYSIEDAAKKANVTPSRLQTWERGQARPTIPQARKLANIYKRPLSVFYLPEPPPQPEPLHDFRRLPDDEEPLPTSPALRLEIRRAYRRRLIAAELLDEQIGRFPPPRIPATTLQDDPERAATVARQWLEVTIEEQVRWTGPYEPLNRWISVFESRGILVFQTKNVPVTESVPLREMRGFSITDPLLPIIVLNSKDAPRGRTFSLLHEFAHLMLNLSGLCEPERASHRARSEDEYVEIFCNHVAGASLVPAPALLSHPLIERATRQRTEWDDDELVRLANTFNVSREVILRRLLILNRTTQRFYEQKRAEFEEEYRRLAQQREGEEGGFAPYHHVIVRNVGRAFARLVLEAFERERITEADVSDYLSVNLRHLDDIATAVYRGGTEE